MAAIHRLRQDVTPFIGVREVAVEMPSSLKCLF